MAAMQHVAREHLADGDLLLINKLGRYYTVTRGHGLDAPPDIETGLTKKQAYTRWSEIVRRDVLELGE